MSVGKGLGGGEQEECDSLVKAEQEKSSVDKEPQNLTLGLAILDRYQNCTELIAGGSFAENGKLVDQHDTYHQCFEACIHMVSLVWWSSWS
jgi:hypothetical protein